MLVAADGVTQYVADVDLLHLGDDFLGGFDHDPAAVGEEEAALGVVRVGVGLRVLVVHAVTPHPVHDRLLLVTNVKTAVTAAAVASEQYIVDTHVVIMYSFEFSN